MEKLIRDILRVDDFKLVIELDDADHQPENIIGSFILTKDILASLKIIAERLITPEGCGIFIKGNYGSGKSHFLSYLYLWLRSGQRQQFSLPEDCQIPEHFTYQVKKISLVKYPAHQTLEGIVLNIFDYHGHEFDRHQIFAQILKDPTVLIIDELSEFLRSKPTPAQFYEDVRFLQFLGEYATHHPLWIIASLQEWIEETGHIASNLFNRIKDRYPTRITLAASHIEDIIDGRVLIKNELAPACIEHVFKELQTFYPQLPLNFDHFKKTYPLHPHTVSYLNGLTPVFSQHRGVIYFVTNTVKEVLDHPIDHLITPEVIFDIFSERIREIPEYSPLVRVVFEYYQQKMAEIFSLPNQQSIALSLLKILILTEISPLEKQKTAKELAELLLARVSTLQADINYELIEQGILKKLLDQQMFVRCLNGRYCIDPNIDEGLRVKREIKKIKEQFQNLRFLFELCCEKMEVPYLPLKTLIQPRKVNFIWQQSVRYAYISIKTDMSDIAGQIEQLDNRIKRDCDAALMILSPFENTEWVNTFRQNGRSFSMKTIACWIPGRFSDSDLDFITTFLAKDRLQATYPALREETIRMASQFKELIINRFFAGKIEFLSDIPALSPGQWGYLNLDRLLSQLFSAALSLVYPHHERIMPRLDYYNFQHLKLLAEKFIVEGSISFSDSAKYGVRAYIDGILEPLGIVKRSREKYQLLIRPDNELVSHILTLADSYSDWNRLRFEIKKGPWGIDEGRCDLLLYALAVTGFLTVYRGELLIENPGFVGFAESITHVKASTNMDSALIEFISRGHFIWGDVEAIPTPASQKRMWKAAVEFIRDLRKKLEVILDGIERYREYSLTAQIYAHQDIIRRLSLFFGNLSFSLAPHEGIEKILQYLASYGLALEIRLINRLSDFFHADFQVLNKYYFYLNHSALKVNGKLAEDRQVLLDAIKDYLTNPDITMNQINSLWENFFIEFTDCYLDNHRHYYESACFIQKKEIETNPIYLVLQRIHQFFPEFNFQWDYPALQNQVREIPRPCSYKVKEELYLRPICQCDFRIGQTAPEDLNDLIEKGKTGLLEFIKKITAAPYREKIEAYAANLTRQQENQLAEKLITLLNINSDTIHVSMAISLLGEETLQTLAKALKGGWRVKKVLLSELTDSLKGRRFKYDEAIAWFKNWLGDESDVLFEFDQSDVSWGEWDRHMQPYGQAGKHLFQAVKAKLIDTNSSQLVSNDSLFDLWLASEDNRALFSGFTLCPMARATLLNCLAEETYSAVKQRIRDELFDRFQQTLPDKNEVERVEDDFINELFHFFSRLQIRPTEDSLAFFSTVLAPQSLCVEKLKYLQNHSAALAPQRFNQLEQWWQNQYFGLEKSVLEQLKTETAEQKRKAMSGLVMIFDGLRYDLWVMLKEELSHQGFFIEDSPIIVSQPVTTNHFREVWHVREAGDYGGKSYETLKWAESYSEKRQLSLFLRKKLDIHFIHFNFIDARVHQSSLDLYPLFLILRDEFKHTVLPLLKKNQTVTLMADHGFTDYRRLKNRYTHSGHSIWDRVVPFAKISLTRV
jgi:hypothetical protein